MHDPSEIATALQLLEAGRFDQTLKLLAGSETSAAHRLRAEAYLGRRKAIPARAHFLACLVSEPADFFCQFGLARTDLIALDAPQAVRRLERLRERAPDWPGLIETLASAYRRDARYEDALALRAPLPSPSLLYERALCLLQLGRTRASLEVFEELLTEAPSHAAGWFWSHAPALELLGWEAAEQRLIAAAACPGANRKYHASLAAYDLLRGTTPPRQAALAFRHLTDAIGAILPFCTHETRLFGVPAELLRWSLAQAIGDGMVCEFGVRRGHSINILAAATDQRIHGFDSFEGLPENWVKAQAGVLTTDGEMPVVPAHVSLHPGWFETTLPPFLADHPGKVRFVNIDSDIYSSARCVLWALADRLPQGAILVFDELIGNRSWRQDEFRALMEFSQHFQRQFEVIAVNLPGKQVVLRLL